MEDSQQQNNEQKVNHVNHDPWKKETKKAEVPHNQFVKWTAIIQIVLLLFIAYKIGGFDGTTSNTVVVDDEVKVAPTVKPAAPKVVEDLEGLMDDDSVSGKKSAKVTIVEFSDFECPFCAKFYSQTISQVKKDYIDTGKVNFIYRDFPLSFHQNAQKAAEAAECAGEQDKFFEMHDKLFEDGVQGGVVTYKQYAKDLGLKTGDFDTCLDSGDMAAEVQQDFLDGQKYGVQGTPASFVNGRMISGACPASVFSQAIEAELEGKDWMVDRCQFSLI